MPVLAGLVLVPAAHADLFDNIQFWVGTGTNRAALEIDWNDGQANDALVWGYCWDSSATGGEMLEAIVAADPRLYAEVGGTGSGAYLDGLGFRPSGDQDFQLNPPLSFNSQHLANDDNANSSRTAVTPGDFWMEGFSWPGFWSYWLSTDSRLSADYSDWSFSNFGMGDRVLANGDVDGWSWNNSVGPARPVPASVPSSNGAPSLNINFAGGQVTVTWPASAAGYSLQQTADFSSGDWTPVTTGIVVSGTNFTFSTAAISAGFFRLQH